MPAFKASPLTLCTAFSMVVGAMAMQHTLNADKWNSLEGDAKDIVKDDSNDDEDLVFGEVPADATPEDTQDDDVSAVVEDVEDVEIDTAPGQVLSPKGDRVPLRMLATEGCDGSSAVFVHAHAILAFHGIETPIKDANHVLAKEYSAEIQKQKSVARAMVTMRNDYKKKNKTLLFREKIGRNNDRILDKGLLKQGTYVVVTSRKNQLDQVTCMVKDCYAPQMGYPVMNGDASDLCMKRRSMNTTDYKAFLNISKLVTNIQRFEDNALKTKNSLEALGYERVEHIFTEDLLDFQWNDEAVETSVLAWKRLLIAWGVHPNEGMIETYLKQGAGTRSPPLSHKDMIYNVDNVKIRLAKTDNFSSFIRE